MWARIMKRQGNISARDMFQHSTTNYDAWWKFHTKQIRGDGESILQPLINRQYFSFRNGHKKTSKQLSLRQYPSQEVFGWSSISAETESPNQERLYVCQDASTWGNIAGFRLKQYVSSKKGEGNVIVQRGCVHMRRYFSIQHQRMINVEQYIQQNKLSETMDQYFSHWSIRQYFNIAGLNGIHI